MSHAPCTSNFDVWNSLRVDAYFFLVSRISFRRKMKQTLDGCTQVSFRTAVERFDAEHLVQLANASSDIGTGNCSNADLEACSVSSDLSGCCSLCRHVRCCCLHDAHCILAVHLFSFAMWQCYRHLRQNPFLIRNDNLSLSGILRRSWQVLKSWSPLHLTHGLQVVFLDVFEESLTSVNSELTWNRPPAQDLSYGFYFCLLFLAY